jgi:hypothetical protein
MGRLTSLTIFIICIKLRKNRRLAERGTHKQTHKQHTHTHTHTYKNTYTHIRAHTNTQRNTHTHTEETWRPHNPASFYAKDGRFTQGIIFKHRQVQDFWWIYPNTTELRKIRFSSTSYGNIAWYRNFQRLTYLETIVVDWSLVYIYIFGLHFCISAATFFL